MEPARSTQGRECPGEARWYVAVGLAAVLGLGLMVDELLQSSATYDEVAYLRVAAEWWRSGDQETITRMGSPLTFWKIQQVPVLWALDRAGFRGVVDDPISNQRVLLPLVRLWSLGIWLAAFLLTATWSRLLYGPRAMALAAALFCLSPNLLAHGSLVTMELPLLACTTGIFLLFWRFLQTSDERLFWAAAALGGLAWSCKFTTALVPPILALVWWIDRWRAGERGILRLTAAVTLEMLGFFFVMAMANFLVTGFALVPMSEQVGWHPIVEARLEPRLGQLVSQVIEWPFPQDWVAFATQVRHQRSGGPSYLFGERRMTGWWYYYFVALAVKVPLTFWVLLVGRGWLRRRVASAGRDWVLPSIMLIFLAATSLGSQRNYGIRYLLPLAPLAIVWVSALAEGGKWARTLACVGVVGQALAVAAIHPHELSYFNVLAGGPVGGRRILADSNLDWGQGAKALARLQCERPEFRDLTLYYFGDTDPGNYGVVGRRYFIDAGAWHPMLPPVFTAQTKYVAVSASLQWGPWGPPRYFQGLDRIAPYVFTSDKTIAIYRVDDIPWTQREDRQNVPLAERRDATSR